MSSTNTANIRTQICASFLEKLASGDSSSLFEGLILNGDENIDKVQLDVALAILAHATSLGPDTLELQNLGWAYSNGPGAGSQGDWDACQTLRLPKNNAHDEINPYALALYRSQSNFISNFSNLNKSNMSSTHSENPIQQFDFPAARYCSLGALPPNQIIAKVDKFGNVQEQLWNAPFSGICVPGICTAQSLYNLFYQNPIFTKDLRYRLSHLDLNDTTSSLNTVSSTLQTQFRYVSSLLRSFQTAQLFDGGILCQDETGYKAMDEDFRDFGYYVTVTLIIFLCIFVVIGTIASWMVRSWNKEKVNSDQFHRLKNKSQDQLLLNMNPPNYDATSISHSELKHLVHTDQSDGAMSNLEKDYNSNFIFDSYFVDSSIGENVKIVNDKDSSIAREVKAHEIDSSSSFNFKMSDCNTHHYAFCNNTNSKLYQLVTWLDKVFGSYFDVAQNFSEITSLKKRKDREPDSNICIGGIDTHVSFNDLLDLYEERDGSKTYYETHQSQEQALDQGPLTKREDSANDNDEIKLGLDEFTNTEFDGRTSSKISKTISISSSNCLDGLRSISMLWIILGHTFAAQSSAIGFTNPAAFFPPHGVISTYFGYFILSARYAVDTFFFISGYLSMSGLLKKLDPELKEEQRKILQRDKHACENNYVQSEIKQNSITSWKFLLIKWKIINPEHVVLGNYCKNRLFPQTLFLRKEKKENHIRNNAHDFSTNRDKSGWILPFLMHRILRILPTYIFVLLIWWKVMITLGDGPYWPSWALYAEKCDQYAWTNMLFVNNIIPWRQTFGEMSECMSHTWYLGVDFQLYATLTPIFLTLYLQFNRKIAMFLECLLIVFIIIASMICSYRFNWSANFLDGMDSAAYDRGYYINPFFRSTPYIIGFITAQLWHEKSRIWPHFGLTRLMSFFLSLAAIGLMFFLCFWGSGGYTKRPCLSYENPDSNQECGSDVSRTERALYTSLMRPLWGFSLALISLLSFNGQLNFLGVNALLSWSGWGPIGRLSFSMYLLHPLVVLFNVLGRRSKIRYSNVELLYSYVGVSVITIFLAIGTGLLVEWPLSKISRRIENFIMSDSKESQKNVEDGKRTVD